MGTVTKYNVHRLSVNPWSIATVVEGVRLACHLPFSLKQHRTAVFFTARLAAALLRQEHCLLPVAPGISRVAYVGRHIVLLAPMQRTCV